MFVIYYVCTLLVHYLKFQVSLITQNLKTIVLWILEYSYLLQISNFHSAYMTDHLFLNTHEIESHFLRVENCFSVLYIMIFE